jgi:flavorubredoxin
MASIEPLRVSSGIHWVGVNDAYTNLFEGLWEIPEGVSYNSYLVVGSEKTALVDSVPRQYEKEHLHKIGRLMNPLRIDYVILNHMEPDHTGAVSKILEMSPATQVVLTPIAHNIFRKFYHTEPRTVVVKGDDVKIDLGGKTLRFIQSPWLHWPETMCTYIIEEKILFSCDAFGSFKRLPNGSILESEIENMDQYIDGASRKYFAGVFSGQREWVLKALKKFEDLSIEARVLAPSHGPVYTIHAKEIMIRWASWSRPDYVKKVVVAFGSMYGMTAKFVEAIVKGVEEAGGQAVTFDLSKSTPIDALTAVLDAPALMIGTPTYERELFPKVKHFLNFLELKKLSDRYVAVYGSFGWSGEATRKLAEQLVALGFRLVGEPLAVLGDPTQEDLEKAKELAKTVAETAFSERGL